MGDPGLPPRPHSLNLLEKLVTEEEERLRNTRETTPNSHQTAPETIVIPGNPTEDPSLPETKMKDPSQGHKSGEEVRNRSRSSSSERSAKGLRKRDRPFSADYKHRQRQHTNQRGKMNKRPGSSKPSSRSGRHQRARSPGHHSSDTLSSDSSYRGRKGKQDSGSSDQRKDDSDVFFDSDKDEKRIDSDTFFDSDKDNKNTKTSVDRTQLQKSKKKRNERTSKPDHQSRDSSSDSESSDYQRRVSVEDYSYSSSFDSDSENRQKLKSSPKKNVTKIKEQTEKPKNKQLLNRKKVRNTQRIHLNPDRHLEVKITQKYMELEDLLHSPFVDPRSHVTREHVYQMEQIRNQYHSVSHGLPPSSLLIPRSIPKNLRNKKQRPWSAGQSRNIDDEPLIYDHAFSTIRSVMAAENARQTDRMRTDINASRPPSGKRPLKKKKIEATLKQKENHESETEDPSISEKTGSQGSSNHSTPRLDTIKGHIDHHIKYSKNEKLKKWLKEKNKVYRKNVKEEREKKRAEREKQILEANEKLEKKLDSDKRVKKWMKQKNKELYKQKKNEEARRRREESEKRKTEVNLPGDSLKIRPQSAPPTGRSSNDEQGEVNRDKVSEERLLEDERKQATLLKEAPHPPQTKFIYKRPVAGKIKFKMQPALQTTIKASGYEPHRPGTAQRKLGESHDEMDQRLRMSYDDWLKKKSQSDALKKRQERAKKDREMAKSDPELNRIVSKQARNRINNLMNSRKHIDTGIKDFDSKLNRSFGGADHDTKTSDKEQPRPRSAYRLEGDQDNKAPPLTVKQIKRPQTAPASRGRVPPPKRSANSPRKAVVPKKVDDIMAEEHTTNAFSLPFPPELGVPKHVAEKQRKIFGDYEEASSHHTPEPHEKQGTGKPPVESKKQEVNVRDTESDPPFRVDGRKAEMHGFKEHKKECASIPDESEITYQAEVQDTLPVTAQSSRSTLSDLERTPSPVAETKEPETLLGTKGSDDIPSENIETQDKQPSESPQSKKQPHEYRQSSATTEFELKEEWNKFFKDADSKDGAVDDVDGRKVPEELDIKQQQVTVETETQKQKPDAEVTIKEDKVSDQSFRPTGEERLNLNLEPEFFDSSPRILTESVESQEETVTSPPVSVPEVVFETSSSVKSGILKESRRYDDPEEEIDMKLDSDNTAKDQEQDEDLESPRLGAMSPSKKRVSFSEQTTVFQSLDSSSSTDTITPNQPGDLNASIDGLDAQPDLDDQEYEKLSFSIGGFELNPAIIRSVEENMGMREEPENTTTTTTTTFLTEPGESQS